MLMTEVQVKKLTEERSPVQKVWWFLSRNLLLTGAAYLSPPELAPIRMPTKERRTAKLLNKAQEEICNYLSHAITRDHPRSQPFTRCIVDHRPHRKPNLVELIVAVPGPTLVDADGVFGHTVYSL